MPITDSKMTQHAFVAAMYDDDYFPEKCVDMVKAVLVTLCEDIEEEQPQTLEDLYELTHSATESINDLADVFEENESELETGAREIMCEEFMTIAGAYGFQNADLEELVAPRDW